MAQITESVDEQSQMIKVLSAIQQIANVTVGQFDVKKLAQQVVENLTQIINAEASSIFLLDEEKQLLIMIAGAGYSEALIDKATYNIGEGVTGMIAKGEPIITKIGETHLEHKEWKGKYDYLQFGGTGRRCYSFLGVPLKFKDKVVGVLKVENKKQDDRYVNFTPQNQQIVEILASHIAAVIENTKLYNQQQTKTIINTLNEVTKGIQGLNEINIVDARFDEVLQRIIEGALRLLNAKFCHIRLIEGDTLKIKAMVGAGVDWAKTDTKVGTGISGKVAESGEHFLIENVVDWQKVEWEGEKYIHWKQAKDYELKACCILPLIVRDEQEQEKILGTLNIYLDRPRFSDVEFEMLKIFVSEAAIAISIAEDIKERIDIQKKLADSQRMAAIGRLTSGLAHGMKNPLQIIKSTVEELKKPQELKPYKRDIDYIDEQRKRMSEIIGIFSKFSGPVIREGIDIEKTIDDVLKRIDIHQNITVSKDYNNIPWINCDPGQIQQVFENLILNAVEAMPGGGILKIITSMEDEKVKISFNNNGKGISDDIKEQIFDPFFTTKKGKGSGLGLYISRYIIQNHKGEIYVESKEEEGATFTVNLPTKGGIFDERKN